MLNLIFQDDSINAVFERNANISKHYANMISRLSEDIDTVVNDVYNEFEKDSENLLLSRFNITKEDILSKLYSVIKKHVIVSAFDTLVEKSEYNLTINIIQILDNDTLMLEHLAKHRSFLYYYYSMIIFKGNTDKEMLENFEQFYF
ncbi:MAG: hypothetical protein V8R82_04325 [Clostridia bacterium]